MSDEAYKVGRGRPPLHTRYKPGQSGNPSGRPKGSRNVQAVVLEECLREVTVKEGGRSAKRPAIAVMTRVMIGRAMQGDTKTGLGLLDVVLRLDPVEPPANDDTPPPEDAAILAAYVERQRRDGDDG